MRDELTRSIETVDLPGLVARLWPESGARPGKPGLCRAVWRGDRHPSLSLFRARGVWFWKDHATGEGGNAFGLLLRAGLSKAEAAELIKGASSAPVPVPSPSREGLSYTGQGLTPAERRGLQQAQARLDEAALRGRGIPLEGARRVGLGLSRQGDLIIPILGPDGQVQAVKARLKEPREYRYRYLTPGRGAPAWHSPGFGAQPGQGVLVVEGELNAIAVWLALEGQADVVGMPGVEGRIPRASLQGRRVYLLADGDEAGREALRRWGREIAATPLAPLLDGLDPCEWAERYGLRGLREAIRSAAGSF